MSKGILLIGMTGQGKSTYLRKLIKVSGRTPFIYDVNNEHGQGGKLPDFTEFLNRATKLQNSIICFEEATIFFSSKSSDKSMRELLIRKRHTNNLIVLLFHSIRTVPIDIFDFVNYYVLFKTNDREAYLRTKYKDSQLLDDFVRLKDKPNHSYIVRKTI